MTIIDREPPSIAAEALDPHESPYGAGSERPAPVDTGFELSGPGRVLLASLSAAAGVIHLVMVPAHSTEWMPEGVAIALAGWFQLATAVLLLARPSRVALRVVCLGNLVFIGAWAITRTVGAPFGPEAGQREAATFVDITCVALQAAIVVFGLVLLAKPQLGHRLRQSSLVALSVIPLAIMVLATFAIQSPSAVDHQHGGAGDVVAAGGHDHGATGGPAAAVDDKGLSKVMNGQGDGAHQHNFTPVPVDAATQQALDAQLAKTKPFMDKYPTVKDAEAAGYHREGPFAPGIGAHYAAAGPPNVSANGTMDDEALAHPTLIYDGTSPDSKLAGFMYLIFSLDTEHPPEGFVGPNDHWHYHTNVCITRRADGGVDAPLGADTTTTKEICATYHGLLVQNTGYMMHVWPVPGYESSEGLFSNVNPKLTCADGTYYVVPQEQIGTRANACRDA